MKLHRLAPALLVAGLALTSCTPALVRDRNPRGSATPSAPAVRTDRHLIAKRFTALGDFTRVHWQGSVMGDADPRVPGPTDVHVQALVVLRPDTLAATTSRYDWTPAPTQWTTKRPTAQLRPFLPAHGDWQASEQYTKDVCDPAGYAGDVYLDAAHGVVFLDAVTM